MQKILQKKSYKEQLKAAQRYAEHQKHKQEIYEIKHKNDKPRKGVAFSKLLLILMLIDVLVIQGFSMYMMFFLADASSIPALLGIVIPLMSLVVSLVSYNRKSAIENSVGGIVYDAVISQSQFENTINEPEEGAVG